MNAERCCATSVSLAVGALDSRKSWTQLKRCGPLLSGMINSPLSSALTGTVCMWASGPPRAVNSEAMTALAQTALVLVTQFPHSPTSRCRRLFWLALKVAETQKSSAMAPVSAFAPAMARVAPRLHKRIRGGRVLSTTAEMLERYLANQAALRGSRAKIWTIGMVGN